MSTDDPLVRFSGVRKSYGSFEAVKGIDLDIGRGEFVAIMGPSGCGKTTTLRMLAGLEVPSAGTITIDGRVMNDVPMHARDTPMTWQSLALFPFLNVEENVEFGLRMRGMAAADRKAKVAVWLERLGLKGFEKRPVDALSGGQRQRVALARSLVTEPQMLLLDEALSALDAHLVIRMQGVLTRLQKELGITFVYVTH
jgi:spermidine/putrescine transport system ATP-binding protein